LGKLKRTGKGKEGKKAKTIYEAGEEKPALKRSRTL